MDLLSTYQNELLGLVVVIILIVVYVIMKKNKNAKSDKQIELELADKESQSVPIQEERAKAEEALQKEEHFELDGKEEGEFTSQEDQQTQEETTQAPEAKAELSTQQTFSKRDVPPHQKITKDDFKEFAGQRILVAEDNTINQKVILGLLADSGIDVIIANDGVEALEILQKDNDFTLVLMDAHMPRMDGFETTREIRKNPNYNHIPVIALSGDTAADDIRKMLEAGMSEHLEKPLKVDALYNILYAYSSPVEKKSPLTFKELNIEEGIEICGDDKEFYGEILKEFLSSYGTSSSVIDKYLQEKNLEAIDKLLLDIIGVTANIGANNLHQAASDLKNSLKDENNGRSRLLFAFKENLDKLIKEIKSYLSQKN